MPFGRVSFFILHLDMCALSHARTWNLSYTVLPALLIDWEIFPSLAPLVPLFRTVPNLIAQIAELLQQPLNRCPLSRQRRLAASLACSLSQSKPC